VSSGSRSVTGDDLRMRVLDEAREPTSATAIAERLGLPRQRVNYHVQALAKAGFLQRAGTRRKRNLVEQRSARSPPTRAGSPIH
jgi:biotin operon repressor